MRKISCYFLLFTSLLFKPELEAQTIKEQVSKKLLQGDSTVVQLKKAEDSVTRSQQQEGKTEIRQDFNIRGLETILKEQEKRRKREKAMAYLRIGIGLLLFIVLIVGWKRRRKIKTGA